MMKKIFILLLLILSIPVMAQKYTLTATHFVAFENGVKTIDKPVNIDATLDISDSRLVIYSKDIQIIDYDVLRIYVDEDNYTNIDCIATDTKYQTISLCILYDNTAYNSVLIIIKYRDFSYSYICRIIQ